jgi:transcriptional regulator with XRE-family HTH domain
MKVNGAKITAKRESLGWSREQLAIEAGVTAQAVFSWEQGNVNTFATLRKVAKAVGVQETELIEAEAK